MKELSHTKIGKKNLDFGEYMEDDVEFSKEIKKGTTDAEPYIFRAEARIGLANFKGAIRDCDAALRLRSGSVLALNYRAEPKAFLEDHKGSIADYTQAIKLASDLPELYNNRGKQYCYLEQYENALEDFNQSLKLNPKEADGFFNRGSIRAYCNDHKGAIKDFARAHKLNPKDADFLFQRSRSLEKLNRMDEANAEYARAFELNPELRIRNNTNSEGKEEFIEDPSPNLETNEPLKSSSDSMAIDEIPLKNPRPDVQTNQKESRVVKNEYENVSTKLNKKNMVKQKISGWIAFIGAIGWGLTGLYLFLENLNSNYFEMEVFLILSSVLIFTTSGILYIIWTNFGGKKNATIDKIETENLLLKRRIEQKELLKQLEDGNA